MWLPDPDPCEAPVAMYLVSRPKLAGVPGAHYGVVLEYYSGAVEVFDSSRWEGLQFRSLDIFLQGREYRIVETLDDEWQVRAAWLRLNIVLRNPQRFRYHVVDRNCEHVARYVVYGRCESWQATLGVVAGGALLAWLFARAG